MRKDFFSWPRMTAMCEHLIFAIPAEMGDAFLLGNCPLCAPVPSGPL